MEQELFARHTAHADQLISFGFIQKGKDFFYQKIFHRGAFRAEITVHADSSVSGRVIDTRTGAEYTAVHVEDAVGSFVGTIRQEYKQILTHIRQACFTKNPFLFAQSNRIAGAIAQRYGEYPDYPFRELPYYGVFRYPNNRKWYGLVMNIPKYRLLKDKKAPKDETPVEILNLKVNSGQVKTLLQTKGFYPCYHMNRANWISIVLDETLPDETILKLLETSRNFVVQSGARIAGKPTRWLIPANPKYFDIEDAFSKTDTLIWKQSSTVQVGDEVYLCVAAPVSAVRYKCQVLEVNIPYKYKDKHVSMTRVMKLKRLKTFAPDLWTFAKLKNFGITALRGPRQAPAPFCQAIEK